MLLAHDVVGDGPPVLLVHAGVADRRMWNPIMEPLAESFRVVRADLRGFGASPQPGERYADADDLDALLAHLGMDEVAVVGASFGGRVAMELAISHPTRVSSLVLLAPAYRGVDADAELEAFGEAEDALLEADDLDGAVALNVTTFLGPEASPQTADFLAAMQRRAFEVQIAADAADPAPEQARVEVDPARIHVPTVIVSGARDLAHFRTVAATLAGAIEGSEHVELDWAGHLPSLERPAAIVPLLLDVLRNDPAVHEP